MDSFIPQSGAICLVGEEMILVSNKSRSRWVIPKGHIEGAEDASFRATQEAWEEAGVTSEEQPLGCGHFHYIKRNGLYRVAVFLLRNCTLSEQWPESGKRTRIQVTPEKAAEMVIEPELQTILLSESLRPS